MSKLDHKSNQLSRSVGVSGGSLLDFAVLVSMIVFCLDFMSNFVIRVFLFLILFTMFHEKSIRRRR